MKIKIIIIAIWLAIFPLMTACSVHYGSPQAVWFWCEMLKVCTP